MIQSLSISTSRDKDEEGTQPHTANMSHTEHAADKTKTGTGAGANVVQDKPILKKDVVREHPEVVHKEHHVQPIIHEKERHVEPVHKTEVTKEHPHLHKVPLPVLPTCT